MDTRSAASYTKQASAESIRLISRRNICHFNIIIVGKRETGKSTLVETLFNEKFFFEPCGSELRENAELQLKTADVKLGDSLVKVTVIETVGFGDRNDKDGNIQVIPSCIKKEEVEAFLWEKLKSEGESDVDSRIHACLYLVSNLQTSQGLKALDIAALKELSLQFNVLPLIAKSDTILKDQLRRFKEKILTDLIANGIETFKFPSNETTQDPNYLLNSCMPFAVVGSDNFFNHNGKMIRGLEYPNGIVDVENENHCDVVKLRKALFRIGGFKLKAKDRPQPLSNKLNTIFITSKFRYVCLVVIAISLVIFFRFIGRTASGGSNLWICISSGLMLLIASVLCSFSFILRPRTQY